MNEKSPEDSSGVFPQKVPVEPSSPESPDKKTSERFSGFLEFESQVEAALREALDECGVETEGLQVEEPREAADLASTLPFRLASELGRSPAEISGEIAGSVDAAHFSLIERVEGVSGYVNFHADGGQLARETLERIMAVGRGFGTPGLEGDVILEHTSANPNGPLHVGHLRNAVVGDGLRRLLVKAGFDVDTQYYFNDAGRQIALVALGIERFGLPSDGGKPDHAVARVYARANSAVEDGELPEDEVSRLLTEYEEGVEETVEAFREAVEVCLEGIRETLDRLGVVHDSFVEESRFVDDVDSVIERLREAGVVEAEENGALVAQLPGIEKELVLRRSDGTSVYSSKDIAYHVWKAEHGGTIDVLGSDHKLQAQQVGKALELIGVEPPELVVHEFVSLPGGSMSTRRGTFVSADELLDEAKERALGEVEERRGGELSGDEMERIASAVGVSAVRFFMSRVAPQKPMEFDMEAAVDFERQGAPFVQYAYARCSGILEKADEEPVVEVSGFGETELALALQVSRLPYVVRNCALDREIHPVAEYCVDLASSFNEFYRDCRVLDAPEETRAARLGLVEAVRAALGGSMELLGVEPLESM